VMTGDCVGLFGEHVPAAVVARPASHFQAYSSQNDQRSARRGPLGQDLAAGHVLSQREAGDVSRSDRRQPADATQ